MKIAHVGDATRASTRRTSPPARPTSRSSRPSATRSTRRPPPATGSFFRYSMREIREELGADDAVKSQMHRISTRRSTTRTSSPSRTRSRSPPRRASRATSASTPARTATTSRAKVWDGTRHAHAYATLSKQFKEAQPRLRRAATSPATTSRAAAPSRTSTSSKNVQCEVCHGPGSLHAAKPEQGEDPDCEADAATSCLACHHPPHVHTFDANAKMADILGPGHGRPLPK